MKCWSPYIKKSYAEGWSPALQGRRENLSCIDISFRTDPQGRLGVVKINLFLNLKSQTETTLRCKEGLCQEIA